MGRTKAILGGIDFRNQVYIDTDDSNDEIEQLKEEVRSLVNDIEVPENATQKDLRLTLTTLVDRISRFGRANLLVMLLLSLPALLHSAPVDLETLSPTTPVEVSALTNTPDNVRTMIREHADSKRYPMFIIPLNGPNESYRTIELKGSTNNFTQVGSWDGVLYWRMMSGMPASQDPDTSMKVYFTDRYYTYHTTVPDPRELVAYDSMKWGYIAAAQLPREIVVILDPSKFTFTPNKSWCNESNEDLIWCYARQTSSTWEQDSYGNRIWHAIQPVKWLSKLPSWVH